MQPPFPDWTRVIRECGRELPAWIRHHVKELGPSARVKLTGLLREADPANEPGETGDYSAAHVAALLQDFEPDDALIEACLARFHDDPGSTLCFELTGLLVHFGPRVAPAVLEAYGGLAEADADSREAAWLIEVLAQCGARSEPVFAALLDALRRFPADVAPLVGHYGDVRALEPLLALLDAYEPTDEEELLDDPYVNDVVLGVDASVAMLGGTLTDEQRAKIANEKDMRERIADEIHGGIQVPFEAPPRPAANAPCWCGSERKYKKCHMAADEEEDAGEA